MTNPFMLEDNSQGQQQQQVSQGQSSNNPFMLNPPPDAASYEQAVTQDQFQPASQVNTQSEGYTGEVKKTAGSFMDKIDIFNRQFERMALGTMQMLTPDDSSVGKAIEEVRKNGYQTPISSVVGQKGEAQAWENLKDPMTGEYDPGAYTASLAGQVGAAGYAGALLKMGGMALGSLAGTTEKGAEIVNKYGSFIANNPGKASVLQNAGYGAGVAGMDEADNGLQRLGKMAVGGALGGAVPAVYQTGKAGVNWMTGSKGHSGFLSKTVDPKSAVIGDIAEKIKGQFGGNADDALAAVQQADDVMKKTGVNMTPGEAFPNSVGYKEKTLNLSDVDIDKQVAPAYFSSQGKAVDKVKSIISQMGPKDDIGKPIPYENMKDFINSKFKVLEGEYISPNNKLSNAPFKDPNGLGISVDDTPSVIKNNPTLTQTFKNVQEAWPDLPNNSVAQLHKVKTMLRDELTSAQPKGNMPPEISLKPEDKIRIGKSIDEISSTLNQSPAYKDAMETSRKKIIMDRYQNLFDAPSSGVSDTRTLTDVYKTIFPKKNVNAHKDQFIQDVIDTGGNVEQAKATVELLDKLQKSPLFSLIKNLKDDPSLTRSLGNIPGVVQDTVKKVSNAGYDRAMLEVTLNPKWTEQVSQVLKASTEKEKLSGIADVMMNAMKWVNTNVTIPTIKGLGRNTNRAAAVEGARKITGQKKGYLQ